MAKTVAGVDTLDGFLRDMRARYPDLSTAAGDKAAPPLASPAPPKAKPQASSQPPGAENAAVNAPAKPEAGSPLPPKPAGAAPRKDTDRVDFRDGEAALAARFAGYVP